MSHERRVKPNFFSHHLIQARGLNLVQVNISQYDLRTF